MGQFGKPLKSTADEEWTRRWSQVRDEGNLTADTMEKM